VPDLSAKILNVVSGDAIDITRTITNIPSPQVLATAWLTIKTDRTAADTAAIIQKEISSGGVAGIGTITDTGGDGTGSVRFALGSSDTGSLTPAITYFYDIQVKTDTDNLFTPEVGIIKTVRGVTLSG